VKKRPAKKKLTTKQRLRKVALWLGVVGLVGVLLVVGTFVFLYQSIEIPDENEEFKTQTSFVYYADGKDEVGQYAKQNRINVPLDEIPQNIQDAVVAAENKTFWTDNGIDPKGIVRAAFSNATSDTTQGASTITQQYVKILYLSSERRLSRKIKEAILSLKIQRERSKREILEGYLNTIYFGRGAYGVQAASQAYFGKDVGDLKLREAAVLASVLNNPTNYDPANGAEAEIGLTRRYNYTLARMADDEMISEIKAEKAQRKLPKFPKIAAESTYGGQRGHMLKLVRDELLRLGYSEEEIDGGGLRVTTTFDKKMMTDLQESVIEQRPEGFGDKQLHVGAATVEPGTGALKAFYGGQDYLDSQINWAATGGMAGSTMKAFTVATALEEGFSLRDSFQGNSPYTYSDGLEVYNAGEGATDLGSSVSMTTATAKSTNTAFVDMSDAMDDGPKKIYQTAVKTGLPPSEPQKKYPGIPSRSIDLTPDDTLVTLGKARVSPINMANAYATFANAGERADVHVVEKVVDADGETTFSRSEQTRRVVDEDIAADTVYALEQVVKAGSGTAALALGRPAAGKTGTATAPKPKDPEDTHVSSAWFVGFTPQLSTAVMYVRGDGDDALDDWLPSYYGGSYPAETWTAIMERVMDGMDVEDFPEPAYVDGDAPSEGHEYVAPPPPPPRPTRAPPRPTMSQEPKPSEEPTPTEVPTVPTEVPTLVLPTPTPVPPTPTVVVPTEPPPEPTPTAPVVPTPTPGG
jgi:membrane peptidoglycan carboxypeptidase